MKKKVLVCGCTGFIGRNMAEELAKNPDYEVFGTFLKSKPFDHPGIKMIKADLTDKKDVENAVSGKDIIIQGAATTSGAKDIVNKPYYHVTDNTIMNALIFRAAFEHSVSHLVFFSCTTMYRSGGAALKETDFKADEEIFPSYFGGAWMKIYNEKMCEFYSRIGKTRFTVIRHSNIYGPHDKYDLERSHVFGATVTKVMTAAEGSPIVVWGEGKEERDLLYVSDLVELVQAVLVKQSGKFELVNAGLGKSVSVSELVKKIIEASGKKLAIQYDSTKPNLNTKLFLDSSKARALFGWAPRTSLEEGIRKTIEWYRKNS